MLVEDTLFLDYLTYASYAVGGALIIVGLLRSHLRLLCFIGVAVPGGMVEISVSQKISLQFDVVILEEPAEGMVWRTVDNFIGGEYVFGDGRRVKVEKPQGGPVATVVINETRRRLHIVRVSYSANTRLPGPGGDEEVATIEAGEAGATLARIGHIGPRADGPPGTMKSVSSIDTLDWLTW